MCDCPNNVETSLISDKGRNKENDLLFYTLLYLWILNYVYKMICRKIKLVSNT